MRDDGHGGKCAPEEVAVAAARRSGKVEAAPSPPVRGKGGLKTQKLLNCPEGFSYDKHCHKGRCGAIRHWPRQRGAWQKGLGFKRWTMGVSSWRRLCQFLSVLFP